MFWLDVIVVLRNIFTVILDKPAGNLSRHIKDDDYNNKSLQFYENTLLQKRNQLIIYGIVSRTTFSSWWTTKTSESTQL